MNNLNNSKLITNIENLKIHDASSFHGMIPNASSYTVIIGDPSSKYKSETEIGIPTDLNDMLENLTTNLVLKDSSDTDIECYSKDEMDVSMNVLRQNVSVYQKQQGTISAFDPYTSYMQNQLVWYDDQVWRCIVRTFQGQWNPSGWQPTTLYNEIQDIRGINISGLETVNIHASVNRGDGVVVGTNVTIHYDIESGRPDETYTFDSSAMVSFLVEYDTMYTVMMGGLTGYVSPQSTIYKAGIKMRNIEMQYRMIGSGIFVIDENGIETDAELWDPANNQYARFVKLTNTQLCPGGMAFDNSIIVSKRWANYLINKKWQIEYRDIPSMPNYDSDAAAGEDYSGWQNCQNGIADCTIPDIGGQTLVSKYNDAHPTQDPITVAEYLPAIYYCSQVTETFMGRTINGYLPSMGQLKILCDNINDFNATLVKIGSETLKYHDYGWWTSTEHYMTNYAWTLHYYQMNPYGDRNRAVYDILPFFIL